MKKRNILLMTTLMTMVSTTPVMATSVIDSKTTNPTFSYNQAQPDFNKTTNEKGLKKLEERKVMLEKTINSDSFTTLSLGERITFVQNYFEVRTDIYKENQKTVLSATDTITIEKIKESLQKDSDNQNNDLALIFEFLTELKGTDMTILSTETVEALKENTENLITSYQTSRYVGSDLDRLIEAQLKVTNSTQLRMLNKFGHKFDINGDKKQALEYQKKLLKLTNGEKDVYKRVVNLLQQSENKTFLFVENELVETAIPLLEQEGRNFMDISDFLKVEGFTVGNEEKVLTVKNGENVLKVNKETQEVIFNEQIIGKEFHVIQDGKLYLPVSSTFKLFHYDVESEPLISSILIHKEIYKKHEVDSLNAKDLTNQLFPVVEEKEIIKTEEKETKKEAKTN